jgi:heme/copper-type cytochrome/quinol oxidase subunit 2
MFEEWGTAEWILLIFVFLALFVIVRFFVWKIRSKLAEVETRHQFSTQRRLDEKKA